MKHCTHQERSSQWLTNTEHCVYLSWINRCAWHLDVRAANHVSH